MELQKDEAKKYNKYSLMVTLTVHAVDDVAAKQLANMTIKAMNCKTAELKLQEIFPDKPPRKVNL